jgi:1-acyl-sn-glycerol-3-phosphate acyltransferase
MKWPILRFTLDICKLITVDRKDIKSLNETMRKIKISIENKTPVTIFPEGTTYKGPGTLPFKKVLLKLLLK